MKSELRRFALLLALVALPALAATPTTPTPASATSKATTTRVAEVRAAAAADARLVATLPANTKVDVLKRVGGWYEVRTGTGATGWVRMWLLRFSAPSGGATAARENVAVLQSGRSSSTYTTATTGVRGLSEEELQNAKPDPAAVQALEKIAVTPDDARAYAKKGALKADPNVKAP